MSKHADTPRKPTTIRMTDQERAAISRLAEDRDQDSAELVRGLIELVPRHEALLRATLEPLRGRMSAPELKLILDVMNGLFLTEDWLGRHLLAEVHDGIALNEAHRKWGIDSDHLLGELRRLSLAERIALEVWCAELWRRYQDDQIWDSEIAWLADQPS